MEILKQRILTEGTCLPGNILKVDSFLNHQLDVNLLELIGQEFKQRFSGKHIDKILTIEASGIGVASITSLFFNKVPVVFAKKQQSSNISDHIYTAGVYSYTKNQQNTIRVDKKFLQPGERILIIDDFLANGNAALGLAELVEKANGEVVGIGVVVEKGFQEGREKILKAGYRLESLAIIKSLENCVIELES